MTQSSDYARVHASRVRLLALGDEFVAGVGDPKALGWLGRVVARSNHEFPIDVFSIAVPGDTSYSLAERWEREVATRLDRSTSPTGMMPGTENRVVIGLGRGDVDAGISAARSRLNLAKVLDGLDSYRIPVFVVGPPPSEDRSMNDTLADFSNAYQDVCVRRSVPFVDTFNPLLGHDAWLSDLAATGNDLPAQAGYGLLAWLVLHGGFSQWLGLSEG